VLSTGLCNEDMKPAAGGRRGASSGSRAASPAAATPDTIRQRPGLGPRQLKRLHTTELMKSTRNLRLDLQQMRAGASGVQLRAGFQSCEKKIDCRYAWMHEISARTALVGRHLLPGYFQQPSCWSAPERPLGVRRGGCGLSGGSGLLRAFSALAEGPFKAAVYQSN
jgi:hypothetical protein